MLPIQPTGIVSFPIQKLQDSFALFFGIIVVALVLYIPARFKEIFRQLQTFFPTIFGKKPIAVWQRSTQFQGLADVHRAHPQVSPIGKELVHGSAKEPQASSLLELSAVTPPFSHLGLSTFLVRGTPRSLPPDLFSPEGASFGVPAHKVPGTQQ